MRPQNGLLNDAALVALIVPGTVLAEVILLGSGEWEAALLVLLLDSGVCALLVLSALYLNRWLRYRVGPDTIEVRGVRGWFGYPLSNVRDVRLLEALHLNFFTGKRLALNGLSGTASGLFRTEAADLLRLHGYAYADKGVLLELREGVPVLLTPEAPDDFLAHLLAWNYPVGVSHD